MELSSNTTSSSNWFSGAKSSVISTMASPVIVRVSFKSSRAEKASSTVRVNDCQNSQRCINHIGTRRGGHALYTRVSRSTGVNALSVFWVDLYYVSSIPSPY